MFFIANKQLKMFDLGHRVMDCHTTSPKTPNLLHWVYILPQKTPYWKPGEFPKAHRQIKGQMVQYGWKYIKIIKWKTSYLMWF